MENGQTIRQIRTQLIDAILLSNYLLAMVLALAFHWGQSPFFDWALYRDFYLFALAGLSLRLIAWLVSDFVYSRKNLLLLSFLIDAILIGLLQYKSALNPSLFLFMYLVVILASGLALGAAGGFPVAAMASLAFSSASLMTADVKSMSFVFLFLVNNASFFAIAWISSYLSEQFELQGHSFRGLKRLHQSVVNALPSGLVTMTKEGVILTANPAASRILANKDIENHRLEEVFPGALAAWRQYLEQKNAISEEIRHLEKTLKVQLLPLSDADSEPSVIMVEDLSIIRKMEADLRQSEKLAAIGQLAAGIAHEIRNPLASISGSIELLSQKSTDDEDKKLQRIILREIDRLNRLIGDFLNYAKPEQTPSERIELGSLLKETSQSLVHGNPAKVQLDLSIKDGLFVRGNADKLKQAFLNFLMNSVEAMSESKNAELKVTAEKVENQVLVVIQDRGTGMSSETKARMFEPFHTTKPKGTGLGLAITHKILQSHRASIDVESEPGRGTAIKVAFPAA